MNVHSVARKYGYIVCCGSINPTRRNLHPALRKQSGQIPRRFNRRAVRNGNGFPRINAVAARAVRRNLAAGNGYSAASVNCNTLCGRFYFRIIRHPNTAVRSDSAAYILTRRGLSLRFQIAVILKHKRSISKDFQTAHTGGSRRIGILKAIQFGRILERQRMFVAIVLTNLQRCIFSAADISNLGLSRKNT
ncbi:MAG: hypothetical protein ACLVB5_14950 [Christensenellales bacterium]